MTDAGHYEGREQSFVKHLILEKYLERFAYIIGTWSPSITYIDCFSGPWESRSPNLSDTSFAIAIDQLRRARADLKKQGRTLDLRCCFIEEDDAAYKKLRAFADGIEDIDICTCHGKLEDSVGRIVKFVRESKAKTFPFVFVDPKGWKGFDLKVIKPLLSMDPCEVLINFMTEHIRRFIEMPHEGIQAGFVRLFGDESFRQVLTGKDGLDRDDACIEKYMSVVQQAGGFNFASSAVVLKSEKDRSHFHLLYLTRNAKGVEVFKVAERHSMKAMEASRAQVQQTRRVNKKGQRELFSPDELPESSYFFSLRERYCAIAKQQLLSLAKTGERVSYDAVWASALRQPLVWESDLKSLVKALEDSGQIKLEGLKAGERTPKHGSNHSIVWR